MAGPNGGKRAGAGRPKGSVNLKTQDVADKLARLGCDPIAGMATIAQNKLDCGTCRGEGKTRYKLPTPHNCPECFAKNGKPKPECPICAGTGMKTWGIRICESCWGTLYEACSPGLRAQMQSDLAGYLYSKRKQIDVSGPDGGPIEHSITVKYVDS